MRVDEDKLNHASDKWWSAYTKGLDLEEYLEALGIMQVMISEMIDAANEDKKRTQ